jgi:hypothetical protein
MIIIITYILQTAVIDTRCSNGPAAGSSIADETLEEKIDLF